MPSTKSKRTIDKHGRPLPAKAKMDIPVQKFYAEIDHDKLDFFLSEHDKYAPFLAALHSKEYATHSFAKIMEKFNISLHELNVLYQDGSRNIGLFSMSNHLPKIMEDVAIDAESKMVSCPRCDGDGAVIGSDDALKVCPECRGAKEIRQIGDKHARDVVFETMKLTSVKGPMVAIQNNQFAMGKGGSGLDSSMEDMLRLTQSVTMGQKEDH